MFTRHNYYMILSLGLLLSFCSSETNQSKSTERTVTTADAQKEGIDIQEIIKLSESSDFTGTVLEVDNHEKNEKVIISLEK